MEMHGWKCFDPVVTANSSQRKPSNNRFKNDKNRSKQNSNNKFFFLRSPLLCADFAISLDTQQRIVPNLRLLQQQIALLLRLQRMENGFSISLLLIISHLIWLISISTLNMMVKMRFILEMVQDRMTGIVLMRGRCEGGVYPVALRPSSSQVNTITLAGTRVSFDCWHHRLGHPTPKICRHYLGVVPWLCPRLSPSCPVFRVNVINLINCHLVLLLLKVILLNFCMLIFGDPSLFPQLILSFSC
ncbi:hypothetical protein I3842_13G102300 [Carya illinoinensis]|uniref:GAG-pre-integrase domain-containing protein n=1 Tax=Carya illinoinensis TaxID=32201 RepID=A0A922ALP1_CARIL|nr:hypothetical protein I3842_13G102300 [Carya illinoinensis]KAG6681617.1 hypothetical protein I3842_13G102300 [Carya illinoinensis]